MYRGEVALFLTHKCISRTAVHAYPDCPKSCHTGTSPCRVELRCQICGSPSDRALVPVGRAGPGPEKTGYVCGCIADPVGARRARGWSQTRRSGRLPNGSGGTPDCGARCGRTPLVWLERPESGRAGCSFLGLPAANPRVCHAAYLTGDRNY